MEPDAEGREIWQLRAEIENVKDRLEVIQSRLAELERRERFRLAKQQTPAEAAGRQTAALPVAPVETSSPAPAEPVSAWVPPELPEIPVSPVSPTASGPEKEPGFAVPSGSGSVPPPPAAGSSWDEKPSPQPEMKESFELRLGKHVLPVLGVVVLLTGLVLAGNFVYRNFIQGMGPGGKVAALYLGAGLLAGAGFWLERRYASLKSYAGYLIAGGAALAYYVTYGLHYVSQLRLIESPLAGGVLLLAAAGLLIWRADRRNSEGMTTLAILLGFYTSSINEIREFTLLSNLVLTAAALWFLLRRRWFRLSVAALVCAYGSYFYWRYIVGGSSVHRQDEHAFWLGNAFLAAYFVMFLVGGLLASAERVGARLRVTFLSANNGAYFCLGALSMAGSFSHHFWLFCGVLGLVLLAVEEWGRGRYGEESGFEAVFLAKGLGLLTLAVLLKLAGAVQCLTLATEALVLLAVSRYRAPRLLKVLSLGAAVAGFCQALAQVPLDRWPVWFSMAALFLAAAWLCRREGRAEDGLHVPVPSFLLSLLGTLSLLLPAVRLAGPVWEAPVLTAGALGLAALGTVLRHREIGWGAHLFLWTALALWFEASIGGSPVGLPWWNPLSVVVGTLALGWWWGRDDASGTSARDGREFLGAVQALAVVGVLWLWWEPRVSAPVWLALSMGLGLALVALALLMKQRVMAVAAQVLVAVSVCEFFRQTGTAGLPGWGALVPLAGLLLLAQLCRTLLSRGERAEDEDRILRGGSMVYHALAGLMVLVWMYDYVPARFLVLSLMLLGAACQSGGAWKSRPAVSAYGLAVQVLALGTYWLRTSEVLQRDLWSLAALAVAPVQLELWKRLPGLPGPDRALPVRVPAILTLLTFWLVWMSGWIAVMGWSRLTVVFWALFATMMLGGGFLLRERSFRWIGLTVFGAALGRVFLIEIWRWHEVYRIISLIALALALLAAGFLYNRFQESIRRWL